MVTMLT